MKKKILFLLPFFPWPLVSGGHQGIFNNIRAVREYAEIHLVYYAGQNDSDRKYHEALKRQIGGDVTIHPYIDRPGKWTKAVAFRKIGNKVFKRADHFSYMLFTKLHDALFYDFVNELVTTLHIDLVQVEMVEMLDFILTLPKDVKRLFVHHELRFVRNALFLERFGADAYRQALFEEEKIKEIALLNRYDLVMTVSSVDKIKLLEAGVKVPVHASFCIINTEVNFPNSVAPGSHRVTYVGPESHFPNKVGLLWFLDHVWPLVKERDDGFRLEIIGKWSAATVKDWTRRYKDVSFLGFVDNLPETLKGSTLVVPIVVGSGMRMKILEAMSSGVPFVSTIVGAEGIPVEEGVHGFITDDPVVFAEDVIRAEDPAVRQKMAEHGLQLVQTCYSATALDQNKRSAYQKLLGIV